MRRMEREFQAGVERALSALRLELVRGLNDGNVGQLTARLDDEGVTRPFQDAVVGQLRRVAVAGSEFGREQVEAHVFGVRKAVEVGVWELANNAAAQWAMSYGYELARGLVQTTRDALQAEVAEYVRNSETIGQLTGRIRAASGFSAERARMIAVTEVTRAFAEGNMVSWRASGVIQKRRWNTNNDELVCPVCGPLAGKVVALDAPFDGGIGNPPAHPRCRCWITPVVVDDSSLLRPAGIPVSRQLRITERGRIGEALDRGLVAIDRVHGARNLPELPIAAGRLPDFVDGRYRSAGSRGVGIVISEEASTRNGMYALVHEVGHYLDHAGLPGSGFSSESGELAVWRAAAERSKAVNLLRDMRLNPKDYPGDFPQLSIYPDVGHLDYLLDARELWSRSYAQYIALRSGDELLIESIQVAVSYTHLDVYKRQPTLPSFNPRTSSSRSALNARSTPA